MSTVRLAGWEGWLKRYKSGDLPFTGWTMLSRNKANGLI